MVNSAHQQFPTGATPPVKNKFYANIDYKKLEGMLLGGAFLKKGW